jgi:WD40 repeat protein
MWRPMLHGLLFVTALASCASSALADEPFEVTVVADSTAIMAGTQSIGAVRKGTRLTVTDSNADWHLVNIPGANPPQLGWIRRTDVRSTADDPRLVVQLGQHGDINSVAFSRDGKLALSGSDDGSVVLWDAATGREIRMFDGHAGEVASVAFSPDGKQVLTGNSDDTARLWNAASGKQIRKFVGHDDRVDSVAFAPDGKQVLTGSWDCTARLWDTDSGREIRKFEGHTSAVRSVAFSPDGKQILTGGGSAYNDKDNTARLWDVNSGKEARKFEGHTNSVASVAFSPDGKQILTGSWDDSARLWDVDSGKEIRKLPGNTDSVDSDGKPAGSCWVGNGFAPSPSRPTASRC